MTEHPAESTQLIHQVHRAKQTQGNVCELVCLLVETDTSEEYLLAEDNIVTS